MFGNQPPSTAPVAVAIAPPPQDVGGWRLDKTIGLAVIITFIAQCSIVIWYASGAYSELADHERRLSHLEMTLDERTKARDAQMSVLTSTLDDLKAGDARIEQKVDDLAARVPIK